jgi:hypothetical protein
MNEIFGGSVGGSALSADAYDVAPVQHYGFQGIFWLNYATLIAGGSHATMANLAACIAAHVATL